ncbi:MAG: putative conjugal transfer protein [Pelotomaculum sp. PtaB.Bin104]|nr:MAG: putative conjugal transfer protein [Pelotomaculum sp. PtaB.Bin104]
MVKKVRKAVRDNYGDLFIEKEESNESKAGKEKVIRDQTRAIIGESNEETEQRVLAYLIGYGDIDPYLKDQTVSDIMINSPDKVYIEKDGKVILTDVKFESLEEVMELVRRMVQYSGRRVDFSKPIVNARLQDGSRVNAVIMPSSEYPVISIRKFVQHKFTAEELLAQGFLTKEMLLFFEYAVKGKLSIVICGAGGSGKTTFMRFLAAYIPVEERIIVIEDSRELALDNPHVVSLEASDKADVYDLMVNALRMRADRIILGEGRGLETFELLQAMGTGHEGSITSVHANYGKKETIQRLVRAMLRSGMSDQELVKHIISSLDLTVFIKKYKDGSRRIVNVSEVIDKNGEPEFNDIYQYDHQQKAHVAVGSLSDEVIERMRDNLGDDRLPDILPFKKR